jgi:hypothetical protein
MKKQVLFVSTIVLTAMLCSAQVPQGFHYQAAVRDANNSVIQNQEVGFLITIQESGSGTPVYVESHTATTNGAGVASLMVGQGTVEGGQFSDVLWGSQSYELKVDVDPAGGTSYQEAGISQIVSVPYALYSGNLWSPTGKFTIQEEAGHPVDSALFEVRNTQGQTVFAVYPEGTRVYILDEPGKGVKGGFAVGGLSRTGKGITQEFMHVSPDSIRLYVNEDATKGVKGGFAVSGYSRNGKGPTDQYFALSPSNASFTLVSDSPDQLRDNALTVTNRSRSDGTGDQSSLLNLTMANYLIGHRAGESITDGIDNCIIGYESGLHLTSNTGNILIGQNSGTELQVGNNNTFIGPKTGTLISEGDNNTMIGALSGGKQTLGSNNIYIGSHSAEDKLEGFENVFIGVGAGQRNLSGNHNIFIGHSAGIDVTGNDLLVIDSQARDSTETLIYGDMLHGWLRVNHQLGIGMNAEADYALSVNGDAVKEGTADWDVTSDRRVKTDIRDIENGLEQILKLRPVTYRYSDEWLESKPEIRDQVYYNYIAQEFAEVFPDAVHRGSETLEGDPEELLRMNSQPAQVVAIRAIQELAEQNSELSRRNQEQQLMIDALLQRVSALEESVQQNP